ncbi:DUF2182 domain-containing protein [Burkholderia savannae]|nr:DUF2182 domain-containing protein [Burkholderia savannae]
MTSTASAEGARGRCLRDTGRGVARHAAFGRAAPGVLGGASALLGGAVAAAAIAWLASMPATGDAPMAGGGTMSVIGARVCGRTRAGDAASFVGIWAAMMTAMMLPSFAPMLVRCARSVGCVGGIRARLRAGLRAVSVAVGYGFVWIAVGIAVYVLGAALAAVEMHVPALARAAPVARGVVVACAGALQFTAWKARHLACCREAPRRCRALPASAGAAWRHGVHFGLRCCCCSAGLTASLVVLGIMDPPTMAAVTAAITAERLAPAGERVARGVGCVGVAAGMILIARAAGLG